MTECLNVWPKVFENYCSWLGLAFDLGLMALYFQTCDPIDTTSSSLFDRQYSVKKLSEKFSVVNMREASRAGTAD